MKSERRHELQHNQLADWIATTAKKIAPYKNLIFGVALLLVVGIAVIFWQVRQSRAQTAQAWEQFYAAMQGAKLADLQDLVEKYPKSQVGYFAALASADAYLNMGSARLFENKATAAKDLERAVENYDRVLAGCRTQSLREQAAFGLARAYEAQGKLTDAAERYEQYLKMRLEQAGFKGSLEDAMPKIRDAELAGRQWPEGAYVKAALLRLKDIERPETKDFYTQFAKFDPKPSFAEEPGIPGKRPSGEFAEPAESTVPRRPGDAGLGLPREERPGGGDSFLLPGPGTKPAPSEKTKTDVEPEEAKPAPEAEKTE